MTFLIMKSKENICCNCPSAALVPPFAASLLSFLSPPSSSSSLSVMPPVASAFPRGWAWLSPCHVCLVQICPSALPTASCTQQQTENSRALGCCSPVVWAGAVSGACSPGAALRELRSPADELKPLSPHWNTFFFLMTSQCFAEQLV